MNNECVEIKSLESSDLFTIVSKMKETELKIFCLAISHIDSTITPKNHTVYVSKKEISSLLDIKGSETKMKESMDSLQKQTYFFKKISDENSIEHESIILIPIYKLDDIGVTIEFNRQIIPYLLDLKRRFRQDELLNLSRLKSKYSVIIYKWLIENSKNMKQPKISVKELREMTNTKDEYQRFQHLETWVLKNSIDEINQYTQFTVTYEKIKSGKYIKEIHFRVKKDST